MLSEIFLDYFSHEALMLLQQPPKATGSGRLSMSINLTEPFVLK